MGLLWNKARDSAAAKLKDGDVTDAKIREVVVGKLNDIKTKVEGLSRKELLSSYRFLKEGVDLLFVAINQAQIDPSEEVRRETTALPSGAQSGMLNEVLKLSYAIGKLKINSRVEFDSAKERFKDARKKATDAFCNEALSIRDRIFAAKLRIVSEILESLENPETAVIGCMSFLKELHDLPAIRQMFSVYLKGGVKSLVGKAERVENVKDIMMINYVLFDLNLKFSQQITDKVSWPGRIELNNRSFNPISDWQEISTRKSMLVVGELSEHANKLILDQTINPLCSTLNSRGDVVAASRGGNEIVVFSKTRKREVVKLPGLTKGHCIEAVAADDSDNVFIAIRRPISDRHELIVLSNCFNVEHVGTSDFLKTTGLFCAASIAVNKSNRIILIKKGDYNVYVIKKNGKLVNKFKRDCADLPICLTISNKNEIMIPTRDPSAVHIYSEQGSLNSTIRLPDGHEVCGVVFHYVICRIIVLSYVEETRSCFLLSYGETGEMETSTLFCCGGVDECRPSISSHSSGHVAVVQERAITFI